MAAAAPTGQLLVRDNIANSARFCHRTIYDKGYLMIPAGKAALVLLAAGRSVRFGKRDKLAQPLAGRPLASHIADTLSGIAFAHHFVVTTGRSKLRFPKPFECLINPAPENGMSASIAIGVEGAEATGAAACLIALADMPHVPASHFRALLQRAADAPETIVATAGAHRNQVPALFGAGHFQALRTLDGDGGAANLLRDTPAVPCASEFLKDYDAPGDFAG